MSNVSCPGNGADYFGQDGNFEINVPTYKLNGGELTDSVTGFVWRVGAGASTQPDAMAECGSLGAGWRLPSFLELASLMDYGSGGNAVPSVIKGGAAELWTSSEFPTAGASWSFSPVSGIPGPKASTSLSGSVCVSGPELTGELGTPTDGVVQDSRTGLLWQFGTVTNRSWKEALLYCLKAQGGGLTTGWRLPSVKELLTIAKTDTMVAIDTSVFNTAAVVWSSTPVVDDGQKAWAVNFNPLKVSGTDVTATAEVRCVHDPS